MKERKAERATTTKRTTARLRHEAEGAGSGAIAGAAFGSIAGPPGMVVGAVLGGAVGAVVAAVLDSEDTRRSGQERELDAEIGVSEGEIGAPNLKHPPTAVGAFSSASVGTSTGAGDEPAEGPIQPV